VAIDLAREGVEIDCLRSEPLVKWAAAYSKDPDSIQCRPLTSVERLEVLEGVLNIYRRAYPDSMRISVDGWNRIRGDLTTVHVPVRLLVRRAVEYLDSLRCTGQHRKADI
jgi:hypothetical protein